MVTWVSAMAALLGARRGAGQSRWSDACLLRRSRRGRQPTGGPGAWPQPRRGPAPGRWAPKWLAGPRWVAGSPVDAEGAGEQEPQVVLDRPGPAVDDRVQQGVGAEDAEFVLGELLGVVVLGHGCLLWWLLPAGRALLLARPGRPGLSGPPRRRSGQGTARRAERALMSAQRPLTAQAARWQPVQQATGRSASGRRVPRRGAAGEAGPCPRPPRWGTL